jgi:anti-sigma factor RsiW
MKCERAREFILTDHMDDELDSECRREVDEHLRTCRACRELVHLVREKISRPLNVMIRETPPAYLWEGIREKITSDAEARSGVFSRLVELIRDVFSSISNIPRPVMAFAVVAMIMVGVLITVPSLQRRALDEYLSEQAFFISRLDTGEVNGASIFDTDINTGTERFM